MNTITTKNKEDCKTVKASHFEKDLLKSVKNVRNVKSK